MTVYFFLGKMLSLLWQICDIIGHFFIVANGQILKNNLTIRPHCFPYFLDSGNRDIYASAHRVHPGLRRRESGHHRPLQRIQVGQLWPFAFQHHFFAVLANVWRASARKVIYSVCVVNLKGDILPHLSVLKAETSLILIPCGLIIVLYFAILTIKICPN